jgi:hypothetical protein
MSAAGREGAAASSAFPRFHNWIIPRPFLGPAHLAGGTASEHPSRFPGMSPMMAAVVGLVFGERTAFRHGCCQISKK